MLLNEIILASNTSINYSQQHTHTHNHFKGRKNIQKYYFVYRENPSIVVMEENKNKKKRKFRIKNKKIFNLQ